MGPKCDYQKIPSIDFPDPRTLFHSRSLGNVFGYANRDVDGLIDAIHSEDDPTKFVARIRQLDSKLKEELPAIPLFYARDAVLVSEQMAMCFEDQRCGGQSLLNNLVNIIY